MSYLPAGSGYYPPACSVCGKPRWNAAADPRTPMTEFCNRDEATCRLLKLNPFLDAAMKQDDPPADKTLTLYLYKPTFPPPDKDL